MPMAMASHLVDGLLHRCLKQRPGWTRLPASVLAVEIEARKMTNHAGHSHRAVSPRATKVEVKLVVLDILIPADRMLCPS